jgi:hypothetical protein
VKLITLRLQATGIVEEAPSGEFQKGDVVATAMGDMGRAFDGGYVSSSTPETRPENGQLTI